MSEPVKCVDCGITKSSKWVPAGTKVRCGICDEIRQVPLLRSRAEAAERRIDMVLRSKMLSVKDGNVLILRGEVSPLDDDDCEAVLKALQKLGVKGVHLVVLPFGSSFEVLSEKEKQELKSSL